MKVLQQLSSRDWWQGFTRVTSGRQLIPEIDGLRFAAMTFVLLLHLNHQIVPRATQVLSPVPETSAFSRLLESGEYGVQLFFAISGFILALPFAKARLFNEPRLSLGRFYLRRFTRLEPPLVINVIALFLLQGLVLGEPLAERLPHLLATIPYLHNLVFHEDSVINPVIWSLEVEAQFYLLTPLLTTVFAIRNTAARRLLLLAGIIAFSHFAGGVHKAFLPSQLEHFLVGFLLADLYLCGWSAAERRHPAAWDLAGLLAWVSIPVLHFFQNRWPVVLCILPFATLLAFSSVFRGRVFRSFFSSRWTVIAGGMCYTFYLYHLVFLSAFSRVSVPMVAESNYYLFYLIQLLILGPLTLAGSAVLFRLTERPFMDPGWPARLRCRLAGRRGAGGSRPGSPETPDLR